MTFPNRALREFFETAVQSATASELQAARDAQAQRLAREKAYADILAKDFPEREFAENVMPILKALGALDNPQRLEEGENMYWVRNRKPQRVNDWARFGSLLCVETSIVLLNPDKEPMRDTFVIRQYVDGDPGEKVMGYTCHSFRCLNKDFDILKGTHHSPEEGDISFVLKKMAEWYGAAAPRQARDLAAKCAGIGKKP